MRDEGNAHYHILLLSENKFSTTELKFTQRTSNLAFLFVLHLLTFLLDRGNDNWLINYEKIPEVDRQVEGEEGVSAF